ncbi:nucleic acid/nucleotide deaminase domain-containing protein [Legionella israelensis]|uniref:C2H2-type domain-containing protein n=1 Tax=Legionella israelensis TaxID=454 RepID=A0A0W0V5G4_9GAMM|nr:nucleic acid/nucleotide deaminase domain-containing protein [Legionella israelensis]KTD14937.1 hypothetical protein Lisr_2282 [Legionella israelensis]QBS09598.1 hypothetical protein E4T55_06830 [Legionella israelensis]SCY23964.1 OTT_1508-like deaminase [Legionella israelensis DSM 19235]STX60522.1 Uncharacterised protein [Legionella israelensis]
MRIEQLMYLIQREEQQRALGDPKIKASKNAVKSILFYGLMDEDIANIIVPKIVDWEFSGEFSKEKLKQFIEQNPEIKRLSAPIRHSVNKTPEQRRMDSLSRLLSLDNKYTLCVAVTFYQGELIASSNSPNPKEAMTESELADCLARKMGLIQNFLLQLTKDIPLGSQPNIKEIQFSSRAKILATDTILKIIHSDNGGVGDVVPSNKQSRHKHRGNSISHLENALLKLAQHCLLGIYTNGEKGFNLSELDTLLNADTMTVITPNTAVLQRQQLHAEQAILHYLREYTDFNEESSEEKINIGISKLCCQACHEVLSRQNDKISHRGSHGMNFPSVYDIDTETLYEGTDTMLGADLSPSDSESECDFFSDEESDFEDDIPPFEELAAGESGPTVKGTAKSRFFKTCSMEANAGSPIPEHKSLDMKI